MSKIFKSMIASMALLAVLTAQTDAGLVRVEFDNLNDQTTALITVSPTLVPGLSIQRTISFQSATGKGPVGGFSFPSAGTIAIANNTQATFTFNVIGGNWGDVYATGFGNSSFQFNGFSVFVESHNNLKAGDAQVSINNVAVPVNNVALSAGFNDFQGIALPSSTQVTFAISNLRTGANKGGNASSIVIGGFQAIPEPTSFLLVGSAILGLCTIRRRKSC